MDRRCSGCHTMDQRLVGPSFKEVAARYAGDPQAARKLQEKVRAGGRGAWGEVPMPPNPDLASADLEKIVGWMLQQK